MPALAEKIPGFDFAFNVVVLAETGTPREAVTKLSSEIAKAVKRPTLPSRCASPAWTRSAARPTQLARSDAQRGRRAWPPQPSAPT